MADRSPPRPPNTHDAAGRQLPARVPLRRHRDPDVRAAAVGAALRRRVGPHGARLEGTCGRYRRPRRIHRYVPSEFLIK